jgi:hypothetical protein
MDCDGTVLCSMFMYYQVWQFNLSLSLSLSLNLLLSRSLSLTPSLTLFISLISFYSHHILNPSFLIPPPLPLDENEHARTAFNQHFVCVSLWMELLLMSFVDKQLTH